MRGLFPSMYSTRLKSSVSCLDLYSRTGVRKGMARYDFDFRSISASAGIPGLA